MSRQHESGPNRVVKQVETKDDAESRGVMPHRFANTPKAIQRARRDERGFTLLELIMVMLIIAVLVAMALPFFSQRDRAWESAARSDLRNAVSAAEACSSANEGNYTNCGDVGPIAGADNDLIDFGFNPTDGVTFDPVASTANRWAARTQHQSGGSAYSFDTGAGARITAIARF